MDGQEVDPAREALVDALDQAGVEFVVIGGAAVQSHGVDYRTEDIDVTPQRTRENLERLAGALNGLACQMVVDPNDPLQDVPLPPGYFTVANLAHTDVWNLRTAHGKLDVSFSPSGFPEGFDQLRVDAQRMTVAQTGVQVHVATLDDVEHSKRTAGRKKDLDYLRQVGRVNAPPGRSASESQTAQARRLRR